MVICIAVHPHPIFEPIASDPLVTLGLTICLQATVVYILLKGQYLALKGPAIPGAFIKAVEGNC